MKQLNIALLISLLAFAALILTQSSFNRPNQHSGQTTCITLYDSDGTIVIHDDNNIQKTMQVKKPVLLNAIRWYIDRGYELKAVDGGKAYLCK